jgi:hypothetical protein
MQPGCPSDFRAGRKEMKAKLHLSKGIEAKLNDPAKLDEMVEWYAEDEDFKHDELVCFLVLLNRAGQLEGEELEEVRERIYKYDPILEEDPWVQGYGDKREARGRTEGEASVIRRFIEKTVEILPFGSPDRTKRTLTYAALP